MGAVIADQIFMVVAFRNPEAVRSRLIEIGSLVFYEPKPDTWLVRFGGTTRELAERLGIRQGDSGPGLVVSISGYSGRASNDLWEWLKLNWSADG
jgi:hypothetical protein